MSHKLCLQRPEVFFVFVLAILGMIELRVLAHASKNLCLCAASPVQRFCGTVSVDFHLAILGVDTYWG